MSHLGSLRQVCAPELFGFLNDAFVSDACEDATLMTLKNVCPSFPLLGWVLIVACLTELVLQHPDLQLYQAVSVEAFVFPPAAVADFVATQIQLEVKTQGSDFGISNRVLLQHVNQTPANRRNLLKTAHLHQFFF